MARPPIVACPNSSPCPTGEEPTVITRQALEGEVALFYYQVLEAEARAHLITEPEITWAVAASRSTPPRPKTTEATASTESKAKTLRHALDRLPKALAGGVF